MVVIKKGINPLDLVNFVQIIGYRMLAENKNKRFNPLDRVKFVQIRVYDYFIVVDDTVSIP